MKPHSPGSVPISGEVRSGIRSAPSCGSTEEHQVGANLTEARIEARSPCALPLAKRRAEMQSRANKSPAPEQKKTPGRDSPRSGTCPVGDLTRSKGGNDIDTKARSNADHDKRKYKKFIFRVRNESDLAVHLRHFSESGDTSINLLMTKLLCSHFECKLPHREYVTYKRKRLILGNTNGKCD